MADSNHLDRTTADSDSAGDRLSDGAVGIGASIVLAVAATLALVLTLLVASLSSAANAATPASFEAVRDADVVWHRVVDEAPAPAPDMVVASATGAAAATIAPRDGTFHVAPAEAAPFRGMAIVIAGALIFGMITAANLAWTGFLRPMASAGARRLAARNAQRGVKVS